jgi:hypothetical protein
MAHMGAVNRYPMVSIEDGLADNRDATNLNLASEVRWKARGGIAYKFGELCGMPASLYEHIAGNSCDGEADEDDG